MTTTDAEAIARKAVKRIIDDLTDRRGLRHAWDGIDDDIRAEIESTWAMIIRTFLASRREAGEVERLRKALAFYANPEIYKPHPHGPAFDRRDLSDVARAALNGVRHDQ